MYKRHNNFYKFNNRNDFIFFVEDCKHDFGCIEDWEDFFGFHMKYDEYTGEPLETFLDFINRSGTITEEPETYPTIAYYVVDNGGDRWGSYKIRVLNYVTDVDFEDSEEELTVPESNLEMGIYKDYVNPEDIDLDTSFKDSIYKFISESNKQGKDFAYIYTMLHKQIDKHIYTYEIEKALE